jgi:hypothetical protein
MGYLQGMTPLLSPRYAQLETTISPERGDTFATSHLAVSNTFPYRGGRHMKLRVAKSLSVGSAVWCLVLILFSSNLFSQEKKEKKQYIRVVAGPVLSFYQNNSFHTNDSKPRYAFFALAGVDFQIHKDFTFMPAVEYVYHGLSFNSYYRAPGYQFLYDKHYDYNYRLTLQEGRLNILVKQTIGVETRNMVTGYTACGYVLRYLLSSNLQVTSNLTGNELFSGKPNIGFEHPIFTRNTASAVKFVGGVQRNYFKTHRAFFFEASFTFSLSRFSLSESFAPSNININGSFLQLGLGVKF